MRFFIADCHFFHENMNSKMDKRGFESAEAMNEYMIGKWNRKVRSQDEVVVLGDLSWGDAAQTNELLKRLHGRLYLIEGNHDLYLKNREFHRERFEWIKPYAELHDNKRKVVLCHYPIMCYNGQYRRDDKGRPRSYMLYGHVHDTFDQRLIERFQELMKNSVNEQASGDKQNIPCNMINCFCMYSDYEPLTLDEWIQRNMSAKPPSKHRA